jgi:hypothetical protein
MDCGFKGFHSTGSYQFLEHSTVFSFLFANMNVLEERREESRVF